MHCSNNCLYLFFIFLVFLVHNSATQLNMSTWNPFADPDTIYYPNPDDDGTLIKASMSEKELEKQLLVPSKNLPDPKFLLVTKFNRNNPLHLYINTSNCSNSKRIFKLLRFFNTTAPLKIMCHGYLSSSGRRFPQDLKDTYLRMKYPPNIILIDWSDYSISSYPLAAERAKIVGDRTARLIRTLLNENLVELNNIHFIGHSLGAHIAGFTGQALLRLGTGKMGRITGLDPAGPRFCKREDGRLDRSDANFVDIIHTDDGNFCERGHWGQVVSHWNWVKGKFGFEGRIGHVDFYPNGGTTQPGCQPHPFTSCSHGRSYMLLQESIFSRIGFIAYQCKNWRHFAFGGCRDQRAEKVFMGEYLSQTSPHGRYYFSTNPRPPFARPGTLDGEYENLNETLSES